MLGGTGLTPGSANPAAAGMHMRPFFGAHGHLVSRISCCRTWKGVPAAPCFVLPSKKCSELLHPRWVCCYCCSSELPSLWPLGVHTCTNHGPLFHPGPVCGSPFLPLVCRSSSNCCAWHACQVHGMGSFSSKCLSNCFRIFWVRRRD